MGGDSVLTQNQLNEVHTRSDSIGLQQIIGSREFVVIGTRCAHCPAPVSLSHVRASSLEQDCRRRSAEDGVLAAVATLMCLRDGCSPPPDEWVTGGVVRLVLCPWRADDRRYEAIGRSVHRLATTRPELLLSGSRRCRSTAWP